MTIPLLCLVCLSLLGWVVALKTEVDELRRDVRRLRGALEERLKLANSDVTVSQGRRSSASELSKGL